MILKRRNFIKTMGVAFVANSLNLPYLKAGEAQPGTAEDLTAESFVDFLKKYGKANPPRMVYCNGQDIRAWQAAFHEKINSLRGSVPERVDPKIEILDTRAMNGYTRKLVRFPVSGISNMVAYILIPDGLKDNEKRPGILALHGHSASGMKSICGVGNTGNAYGLWAVKAGYIVIAPSWWGWYGRDAHRPLVGNSRDKCNVQQMAASMYGINVLDLHIQDGQAAIDVLASLPETDQERIACMGLSYGGRMAMWLSVFEKRIAACVSAGAMNNFRERSLKLSSCAIQFLPGTLQYGDVPEIYSLIAPRPLLLQAGRDDRLITPLDRDNMAETVRNTYSKMQAESNFEFELHEGGHILNWESAERFLGKHLSTR